VKPTRYLANFDSSAAMVRALANYIRGEDFPLLGAMPRWRAPDMKLFSRLVNASPRTIQEQVYIWAGRFEAVAARKLDAADAGRIAEWVVSLYPKRRYPAIAIGSSNGALTHLWCAFGIPWLPQTFLVPVARHGPHPDEPQEDLRWAEEPARAFLKANPDVQLHHLHDPNQDRLMIQRMTYFRFKKLSLGHAYERFIEDHLEPGGTIFIVDCGLKWPTTRIGDRYVFQFGALGGARADEYHQGGERVTDYLRRHQSHRTQWEPPRADAERPEAEWGFEPRLAEDIERLAQARGYRIRRVAFKQPEHASPFVADFYRWWNEKRGVVGSRLLVESFIVMEPYWTVRTGSVPFWMVFNMLPSADALETYLNRAEFDDIHLMLFSHGVDSIGLAPVERWRALLARARRDGRFTGVDPHAFPRDFAVFVRYHYALKDQIKARYPAPPPLMLDELDAFLAKTDGRYPVRWS